jgi:hypothetical protein
VQSEKGHVYEPVAFLLVFHASVEFRSPVAGVPARPYRIGKPVPSTALRRVA